MTKDKNKVFFLREEYENGQGRFIYPNGQYSGEWGKGKKQGQGTYTHHDGRKYEGEWKDGEVWNGIVFDSKQNIIETWLNGLEE